MGVSVRVRVVVLTALVALWFGSSLAADSKTPSVRLELAQQFYYVGDALDLRITVFNPNDKKIANPIETPLFSGFKVRHEGEILKPEGRPSTEEPARPGKLGPDSFYGGVVNLLELFPRLASAGTFQIFWNADGIVSPMVVVTIIPRFDASKKYMGTIETSEGTIVVELFGDSSPIAVKSFVDMANSGFYDGLQFHEVRPNKYIVGGDPRFGDRPRYSIQYPAEQSNLPLVAGTVVMRPVSASPPGNGSIFVILLRPQPEWTGQVTPLGQVVSGLDVVQRLSREPSSMLNLKPHFKPLRELKIEKLTIHEKPEGASQG